MRQVRQGDVFVERIRRPSAMGTAVVTPDQRVILAYGEVTGHCHEIARVDGDVTVLPPAALFQEPDGTLVLLVERPCQLVHQEHGAIALTPGAYRVTRQREYSPSEIRQVAD